MNPLATTDVLGHDLLTFFEKVHEWKKGKHSWTHFVNQSKSGHKLCPLHKSVLKQMERVRAQERVHMS